MAFVEEKDILIDSQGLGNWSINMTGPIGGTYQGNFQFRNVLSPLQQIEADRDYRDLIGKNAELVGSYMDNLAFMLAQLKQRVVKSPPFWDDGSTRFPGGQIRDQEILQAVYEASVASETKYRAQLIDKQKESIERLKASIERREQEAKIEQELMAEDNKKK